MPDKQAIVDTGAPISLLPLSYWRDATYIIVGHTTVSGFVRRPGATQNAIVAELLCSLTDGSIRTPPFRMPAFLVESDDVPAVLGFADCLDRFRLVVDAPSNSATLEFGS